MHVLVVHQVITVPMPCTPHLNAITFLIYQSMIQKFVKHKQEIVKSKN